MNMPAKGPVFSYLVMDFVRFTSFFTYDLVYLVIGLSGLSGEGCLADPLLSFTIGLCYKYA